MDVNNKTILISRTDGLGDCVLTLPMCGILKKYFPDCRIIFLAKTYTMELVELSKHIDRTINYDDFSKLNIREQVKQIKSLKIDIYLAVLPNRNIAKVMKKARVPVRTGTTHRYYHWWLINKGVNFSRRKSNLHEAQLNIKLLKPLGIKIIPSLAELQQYYGIDHSKLNKRHQNLIDRKRFNLILHPKSKGSAREWSLEHYDELLSLLDSEKFQIFLTGTEQEGILLRQNLLAKHSNLIDLTGKFTLKELIGFISCCNCLVACSTGTLHIAAMLNINALGLFPSIKPLDKTRWQPIGQNVKVFQKEGECVKCRKSCYCECINSISSVEVSYYINQLNSEN